MTADPESDVLAAALIQISSHAERISALDAREASHYQDIADRLGALATDVMSLTGRIDGLGGTLSRQSAILGNLDGLDRQVAALAAQLTEFTDEDTEEQTSRYQPVPSPRWWKLTGTARDTALDRLRAWIEQIYRPSYGHIAAALPRCWEHHPFCLHTLDWLSELWSVLYLSGQRTSAVLAAQAEWQTRLLPTAAHQMRDEANGCTHSRNIDGFPGTRPSPDGA